MKFSFLKPFVGVVLIVFIFSFSGCNLFDDVTDVTIETELESTYTVSYNETGENIDLKVEKTISIEDNPDIAKYSNKFKEFYVESISYRVIESSDETVKLTDGELSLMGTYVGVAGSLGSEVLFKPSETDTILEDFSDEEYVSVASLFKDQKEATAALEGKLSKAPITAKILFKYKVKVVAEAID